MAKIDSVRRECEDIGTHLTNEKRFRGAQNVNEMAAIAKIHTKALSPEAEPTALLKELDEFRKTFNIHDKVAAYPRPEAQ